MKLIQLLSDSDIDQLMAVIGQTEWRNGGDTATGSAKDRKKNLQITETDRVMAPVFMQLKTMLVKHAALRYTAFPRKVVNIRVAKYGVGDAYGWHVDQAIMEGHRSDISFTIFLSGSDSYDGGELELDMDGRKFMAKGEKGQMFFYPTGVLHQVRPVTRGERVVIVGWFESLIPNAEDRENLITLFRETAALRKKIDEPEAFDKLNWAIQHMVRRLASR